jgi:dTDP-4-amino-4,6-dideoxygalactose transaminase
VVHLFGQMPDMDGILVAAAQAGLYVIEDAAQAHGAEWRGRRAGSFGTAACFSFYPGKNLGAFGDAGAVVTSEPYLADRVRTLANHGRSHGSSHHEHTHIGRNSRLDTLQAILLSGKLAFLETWTRQRIAVAARYREALDGRGPRLTGVDLFVVRVGDRDTIRAVLARHGVETGVHYPVPCHRQPPFRQFASWPLPVAERAAGELLSLPMFPHLTGDQVEFVCRTLTAAVHQTTDDPEFTHAR